MYGHSGCLLCLVCSIMFCFIFGFFFVFLFVCFCFYFVLCLRLLLCCELCSGRGVLNQSMDSCFGESSAAPWPVQSVCSVLLCLFVLSG